MYASQTQSFDQQIAPDTLLQQHDLMVELYRLDQAALLARRQERNEELRRIVLARQRVNDVLSRLAG